MTKSIRFGRVKAARADLLAWSQEELSGARPDVSHTYYQASWKPLTGLLGGRKARRHGTKDSAGASAAAGIEFIDENGGGPGVRLKKPHKKRT